MDDERVPAEAQAQAKGIRNTTGVI